MTITELPRPRVARMYLKASQKAEQRGAHHRRRLLDRLTGTVIELGAGRGLNFPHYPAIERAGFTIRSSNRIMFAASRTEPSIPHILCTARRA